MRGQVKENLGLRQFWRRGLDGARMEVDLGGIAHNLKKIWKMWREKRETLEKSRMVSEKNLDWEIFVRVYLVEDLIVGQRRLLYAPSETKCSESATWFEPEARKSAVARRHSWMLYFKIASINSVNSSVPISFKV